MEFWHLDNDRFQDLIRVGYGFSGVFDRRDEDLIRFLGLFTNKRANGHSSKRQP